MECVTDFLKSMLDRAAELMFEKYKVPALFMAKNPVFSLFFGHLFPTCSCESRCLTIYMTLPMFFRARFSLLLLLGVLPRWSLTSKNLCTFKIIELISNMWKLY